MTTEQNDKMVYVCLACGTVNPIRYQNCAYCGAEHTIKHGNLTEHNVHGKGFRWERHSKDQVFTAYWYFDRKRGGISIGSGDFPETDISIRSERSIYLWIYYDEDRDSYWVIEGDFDATCRYCPRGTSFDYGTDIFTLL